MSYVALARKYRPLKFEDFVGQEAIAQTLKNAIATDKVSHAYLFCGSRGTGKTSMSRVFAMALNCKNGPTVTPCGQCDICHDIQAGQDLDVQELDGASNNGVDQVRALRENARFAPSRSRYRIYYIDEAHMLSTPAFNALLKTLEEPPKHVKFILATTAATKIPETIHSRCQRFDFRRISAADIARRLTKVCADEGIQVDDEALTTIGRKVMGGMRDALSLLDQLIAFSGEKITVAALEKVLGGASEDKLDALLETLRLEDIPGALRLTNEIVDSGSDLPELLDEFAKYVRALLIAAECGPQVELLERPKQAAERLVVRSKQFSSPFLMYAIQVLYEARQKTRLDLDSRIVTELALIKLARARDTASVEQMLARLDSLGGSPVRPISKAEPAAATPAARTESAISARSTPEDYGQDAVSPAPSPAPSVDIANLDAVWSAVAEDIARTGGMMLKLALPSCRLRGCKDSTAIVGVRNKGHFNQLDSQENRAIVSRALARVLARDVSLQLVLDAEQADKPAKTAIANDKAKGVAEMFGGHVINRRKAGNE
jgi:DNA polymerase III subunit gamma/tau